MYKLQYNVAAGESIEGRPKNLNKRGSTVQLVHHDMTIPSTTSTSRIETNSDYSNQYDNNNFAAREKKTLTPQLCTQTIK